jgi:hypothetical protein
MAAPPAALNVAVTDSVASNNNQMGFYFHLAAGHSVSNLVLTRSTASGNGAGIVADSANATLWLAQSTVTENSGNGYNASSGGVINSYGDNYIDANGTNTGTLSTATKQ